MKVEVAILGSPSQMYCLYGLCGRQATLNLTCQRSGACESGGGHPGLPVPNSLYVPCGRKATLNSNSTATPATVASLTFRCVQPWRTAR